MMTGKVTTTGINKAKQQKKKELKIYNKQTNLHICDCHEQKI